MKITLLIINFFILINTLQANDDWGKTGHRTIGEIAENYLNNCTKRKLNKILNYDSLALISNHSDDIKSDSKFSKYFPWHYVNFQQDKKYGEDPINKKGDLVQGIKKCIETIRSKESNKKEKAFFIKMLVHFIGDLHQPLHVGNSEDKGGNNIKLKWFYKDSNLHRVWDSEMIDSFKMSYSELASNTTKLTKGEICTIKKGSLLDWVYESKMLANEVYNSAKAEDNLTYKYMYKNFPIARSQLQKGGIRLAYLIQQTMKKKSKWIDEFLAKI